MTSWEPRSYEIDPVAMGNRDEALLEVSVPVHAKTVQTASEHLIVARLIGLKLFCYFE